MQVTAGIDIGGTGTRFVALDHHTGVVEAEQTIATAELAMGGRDDGVERLASTVLALLPSGADLNALGIGASGPVDPIHGTINNTDTLAAFSGFRIVAALERRLSVPVVLDNDAMVAAIAEHRLGAGKGLERVLLVCLGTGVGVALVVSGAAFRGLAGAHPEASHFPIASGETECCCGIRGCWEQLASRRSLQETLRPLLPISVADRDIIDVAAALDDRDDVREVFFQYGRLVGRGLVTLQSLYMPNVIVIGGSASQQLSRFTLGIHDEIRRAKWFPDDLVVRRSTLSDTSGALGAAMIAREADAS